jgi:diguanylate cyclase (GGDEF)-like protein/PAS domain S-box-containing protein
MIDMHDYPPAAKRFWFAYVALGAGLLAWALWQLQALSTTQISYLLLGGGGAMVAGFVPVQYPKAKWSFTVADVFHLLMLLTVGPAGAVLTVSFETFTASMRTSKRGTSRLGGPAASAVSMSAAAYAYPWIERSLQALGSSASVALLLAIFVAAVMHQLIVSLILTRLLQLKKSIPYSLPQWWKETAWMLPIAIASGAVAGLIYLTTQAFGITAFLVAVPLIVLISASLHYYYENVTVKMQTLQDSEQHLLLLAASERRFHQIFDQSAIGLSLVDDALNIKQANPALAQMLGSGDAPAMLAALHEYIDDNGGDAFLAKFQRWAQHSTPPLRPLQAELPVKSPHGAKLWLEVTLTAFDAAINANAEPRHDDGKRYVLQVNNFTRRRESENRLAYLALHDSLTGLANRAALLDALEHAIERSRTDASFSFAVVMLDFDRFKLVNDSLGHAAGDEMLVKAAQRLRQFVRGDDMVARFGGDEFAILFQAVSSEPSAVDFAARMQSALSAPMTIAGLETYVTASVGITFSHFGYVNAGDVLRDADAAMYEAKRSASGIPTVFNSLLHEHSANVFRVEADLRKGLRDQEFSVYYQPIWELSTLAIVGFEALLRWHHPSRGLVLPASFIRVAETTGLMAPIGRWVILDMLRTAKQMLSLVSTDALTICVNVSAVQLQEQGFATWLIDAVRERGLQEKSFCLEVTEAVFIEGHRELSTLTQLRSAGFHVSLDDFGTGYSSLSYLQRISASTLKLDREFTQTLCLDEKAHHIARCVVDLACSLNMKVCAEGVETSAQLDCLRALGVHFVQGFMLAKPMPLNELMTQLALPASALR